jgi:hypothetical protein
MTNRHSFSDVALHPMNWPPNPETQEEFDQWMAETDTALRTWLEIARNRVQKNQKVKDWVEDYNIKAERIWATHEPNADVQTGEIDGRSLNNKMQRAMKELQTEREKLHIEHETWYAHSHRMYAEIAWEEFLYYQNVWNRKYFDPYKNFYETKKEREYTEAQKKREARQTRASAVGESRAVHDEKTVPEQATDTPLYEPKKPDVPENCAAGNPQMNDLYFQWLTHMITLYTRFKLAYRKQMPEQIDANHAHRYSQPPRGTTNQEDLSQLARHEHLEIRFPRQKRKRGEGSDASVADEVEEGYPSRAEIQKNKQYEATNQMEQIKWRLDEASVKESVRKNDSRQRDPTLDAEYAEETRKLLPSGHTTYHSSKATSFDWPTSYDSNHQGNNIAITLNRKEYIYEPESDAKKTKKVDIEKRRDEYGRFRKIETKPRYKMVPSSSTKTVRIFEHDRKPDGSVEGRDRYGNWQGRTVPRSINTMKFKRGIRDKREEVLPRFIFKRRFQVRLEEVPELSGTRQTRHKGKNMLDQLSGDEGEDCTKNNKYFQWSGNANPDQATDGSDPDGSIGEDTDTGGRSGGEDEKSDDEGDLFKQSYEECSGRGGCPTRRRAGELHARLVDEIGELPFWKEYNTLGLVELNHSEGAIRKEYMLMMKARKTSLPAEQ